MMRYAKIIGFKDVPIFILVFVEAFLHKKEVARSRFGEFSEVPKMIQKVLESIRNH